MSNDHLKSTRINLSGTWGSSSQLHVNINNYSGHAGYYQNGKDIWTAAEAATGICNIINGSTSGVGPGNSQALDPNLTGVSASISLDDPTTVILRSTVINGPLEFSYSTGTSNHPPGTVTEIEDNDINDSIASISLTQIKEDLSSNQIELSPSITGDSENIHSYSNTQWLKDNIPIDEKNGLNSLIIDSTIDASYKAIVTYFDGELNEYSITSASVVIDNSFPTLSNSSPANNATSVALDSNIILTFSEVVDVESGNILIKKTSDNSTVESIDVTSTQVTGSGSTQITINPSSDFDSSTQYYLQIPGTAFDDSSSNSFSEITDTTSISFTTISPSPAYTISPSSTSINEGSTLTTSISTTNVDAGTTLYWSLSGSNINSSDFSSGSLTGSGNVGVDGSLSFSHTLANDLNTEGNETLNIKLFSDSSRSTQVGSTASVSIGDTSVSPSPAYTISPSSTSINEGSTLTTSISTTNVDAGTTLYWSLSGSNINSSDFSSGSLTGSGNVGVDGSLSFSHTLANDLNTEGNETLNIKLFSDSSRSTQVGSTASVTVKDTSNSSTNTTYKVVGENYQLNNIKDYDGNLHGFLGEAPSIVKSAYKYQGKLDVNDDGVTEEIFTNKESGRWVTASIDPITGAIDYTKHGQGGTTRVVGIYEDPLVKAGLVEKDSDFDGSRTFINDLKLDNLILKTVGDYDGDGFQEVYWSKVDNTAYLRAVMHADGNIQYANYQNLDQMTDYLTNNGFADTVTLIA